jgi:prolyl oligopeptidase
LDSEASVFLDPNLLSVDGTTSLSSSAFSRDGKKFAYTVNRAGSDWQTAYIKDVESKCDLKDVVEFIKFSGISWTSDNLGFFYCKYPRTEKV